MLISSGYLAKDMILHPRSVFEKIKEGDFKREALVVFGLGALISFLKSFLVRREQSLSFFVDERLNQLFSILHIPQVRWFVLYVVYLGFLLGVFAMCRCFNKEANLKSLALAFMATSIIGVLCQIIFYPISWSLPSKAPFFLNYIVLLWCIWLSFQALRVTQNLSFSHALVSYLIPAIVVIVVIGLPGLSPSLAWLASH